MPTFQVPGQRTRTRAFSALVRLADPNFDKERRREPEYKFEGGSGRTKTFYADVRTRGVYNGNN